MTTATFDMKRMRKLVGAFLDDPDADAWLVAADYAEEHGEDDLAKLWRDRAGSYAVLRAAIDGYATIPHLGDRPFDRDLLPSVSVGGRRLRMYVLPQWDRYDYIGTPTGYVNLIPYDHKVRVWDWAVCTERTRVTRVLKVIDRVCGNKMW